jgi:hypothetical protein
MVARASTRLLQTTQLAYDETATRIHRIHRFCTRAGQILMLVIYAKSARACISSSVLAQLRKELEHGQVD